MRRSELLVGSGNVKKQVFHRSADAPESIVQCGEGRVLGELIQDLRVTLGLMC